jgi:hypothetical protein
VNAVAHAEGAEERGGPLPLSTTGETGKRDARFHVLPLLRLVKSTTVREDMGGSQFRSIVTLREHYPSMYGASRDRSALLSLSVAVFA